ncbi:MAG: CPXCG motif-containing cysteine-rich protein [Pirellula sp.]
MKILYLHGWKSVPGGVKPTYLRAQGAEVIEPKLDDDDFGAALSLAQAICDQHSPDVIVGSSRGGAVAINLSAGRTPRVLLCPAWKKWGRVRGLTYATIVLHSRLDDVIPFEDSEELVSRSRDTECQLIEVGRDHRLADPEPLEALWWACTACLDPAMATDDGPSDARHRIGEVDEGSYVCGHCGETIVIPLDPSEGSVQHYTEDCPVCCHANVIHITRDSRERLQIWSESEHDEDSPS